MRPPARIKDIQKLTGCLATLSQFISRLVEQALSIFKMLWKSRPFVWIEEVDEAFLELKQHLTSQPIMVAPEPSEHLLLYITAKAEVVSMVLVAERPEPKPPQALKGAIAAGSGYQDPDPVEGHGIKRLLGPRYWIPPRAPNPKWGLGSWMFPQIPRMKRLLDPRSRSPLRVPTASTPLGPNRHRCP
jgi:hypothetical protein